MKLDDFRAIAIASRAFLPSFYFCELRRKAPYKVPFLRGVFLTTLAYWWRKRDAIRDGVSSPLGFKSPHRNVSRLRNCGENEHLKVRGLELVSLIKQPRLSLLRRLAGDLLLCSSRRCLLQGEQRIFEAKIYRTTEGTRGIS